MALLAFEQSTFISSVIWGGPLILWTTGHFCCRVFNLWHWQGQSFWIGDYYSTGQLLLFVSTENISTDPNHWLQVLNSIWSHHIATFFAIFTAFGSGVREMGALSYRLPSSTNIELIWLQCHFTQLKPISINWLPNIAWALLKSRGPNLVLG